MKSRSEGEIEEGKDEPLLSFRGLVLVSSLGRREVRAVDRAGGPSYHVGKSLESTRRKSERTESR
jgi:hypothetical protein